MSDQHSVVITTKDIYEQLVSLNDELKSLRADVRVVVKGTEDQEERIRKLEAWKYALPATLVIAAASIIAQIIQGS